MRILHTADWHLGKMFYGGYLTDEQHYVVMEQLLPMIKDERIDVVLLAGDVYDRSLPPTDAVALFDEIATKITTELHVPLVVISGNHDSAARLSFGSTLFSKQGLYIEGELQKTSGPIILQDTYGPIAFVPIPFTEPAVVRTYTRQDSIRSHDDALAALIAMQGKTDIPRKVCIAHTFVVGSMTSDSERPLSIGGSDAVRAELFSDFTYTALGHLHGPQRVGSDRIRYSGSLLKYSFGEATQKKGVVVADIDGKGAVETTFLPLVPRHDVRILEGAFSELIAPEDGVNKEDYVLIRLTDKEPILDGMAKLRRVYPRVMALETPNRVYTGTAERPINIHKTTEKQLFSSFIEAMQGKDSLTAEAQACMDSLWEELRKQEGDGLL